MRWTNESMTMKHSRESPETRITWNDTTLVHASGVDAALDIWHSHKIHCLVQRLE